MKKTKPCTFCDEIGKECDGVWKKKLKEKL